MSPLRDPIMYGALGLFFIGWAMGVHYIIRGLTSFGVRMLSIGGVVFAGLVSWPWFASTLQGMEGDPAWDRTATVGPWPVVVFIYAFGIAAAAMVWADFFFRPKPQTTPGEVLRVRSSILTQHLALGAAWLLFVGVMS